MLLVDKEGVALYETEKRLDPSDSGTVVPRTLRDVIFDYGLSRGEARVLLDLEALTLRRPAERGGPIEVTSVCKVSFR